MSEVKEVRSEHPGEICVQITLNGKECTVNVDEVEIILLINKVTVAVKGSNEPSVIPTQLENIIWCYINAKCGIIAIGTQAPSFKNTKVVLPGIAFNSDFQVIHVSDGMAVKSLPQSIIQGATRKFSIMRTFKTFEGNTIVCNIPSSSPVCQKLIRAQEIIRESNIGYAQALLPPSSFHMTILSLVNEGNRDSYVKKKNASWSDIHKRYNKVTSTVLSKYNNVKLRMEAERFKLPNFCLEVVPADRETASLLQSMLRDLTKAAFGKSDVLSHRRVEHVSLGYCVLPLGQFEPLIPALLEQIHKETFPIEFELDPPFFAVFTDMAQFSPM